MAVITVRDVARTAQVSVATVSRVLNGSPNVNAQLKERVLAAVDELNYSPNRVARGLRRQTTNFVALVVPDIRNPFFAYIAQEIEELLFHEGYTLLTCNTNDDPIREAKYCRLLSQEAVAGIIICTAHEHQGYIEVNKLLEKQVAVVAFDRRLESAPVDLVLSDNFGGARRGVSYLIELGHRRIAVITGPDRIAPARERLLGYEQALRDYGLAVDSTLIRITNFRDTGAETATHELLSLGEPPTALFVASGNSAIGSLRALNSLGLRIPRDVSFLVFDDLEWAAAYNPPLTAIGQDYQQIAKTAVELLLKRVAEEEFPPVERRIPTTFHVRDSCMSRLAEQADQ